jgi:hypothetical protein
MGEPAAAIITEDEWQRRATAAAISAAKDVLGDGLNSRAPIGSLSEIEWGWIAAAIIFGWIKVRAEQAVAEGTSYDSTIQRALHRDPAPWEAGAIETILPKLGSLKDIDWSKPVGEWSKGQIVGFAWQIYKMTDAALQARDDGANAGPKIVRFSREKMERENSAANGGPLFSKSELNDDIPF